jgi:transcription antitermination factor NusG
MAKKNSKISIKTSAQSKAVKKFTKVSKKVTGKIKSPKGNQEGWVALELTQRGETERNVGMLRELVVKNLGKPNVEVFVPIHYENEEFFERNIVLLSGYFFIKHQDGLPYYKLKDSKFFEGVVCDPLTQTVQLVPEDQMKSLREQFDKIAKDASQVKVGDTVRILDGLYKNLIGKVVKVVKKDNMCIIDVTSLKSRNITVSASFLSVTVVEDDESDVVTFF